MTAIDTRLAEIRARAENATPGPWESDGGEISQHWSRPKPWLPVISTDVACISYCYGGSASGVENKADAEFIAASRTDVPWLLDQVELRDKALEAVMELHQSEPHCNNVRHTNPDAGCPECAEYCTVDGELYPCRTITALTAALDANTTTREDPS